MSPANLPCFAMNVACVYVAAHARANKQLLTISNFILGDCYNCWNLNMPLLDGVVLCCYYWNICLRNFFHYIVSLALHLRYDYVPVCTDDDGSDVNRTFFLRSI